MHQAQQEDVSRFRFNADEWKRLPLSERIARCRMLAIEAQTLGRAGNDRMKTLYLGLAIHWKLLSEELSIKAGH